MGKRKRRKFTQEFKEEAARLCKQGDRSIGQIARDMDLSETALRRWVQQYDVDHGKKPRDELTTAERDELRALRRRVRTLEQEREILKNFLARPRLLLDRNSLTATLFAAREERPSADQRQLEFPAH